MIAASIDLRVTRTHKLIEQALLDILENEGIKALTVKNLTQKAGINRGTFYLHYKDIFDLIEQTEIMRGLLKIFVPIPIHELLQHKNDKLPFPAITEAFNYFDRHSNFFKAIFHSSGSTELRERLQFLVGSRLYENLKPNELTSEGNGLPASYIIAYLGAGQFGIIQHWFDTDMSLPPAEIALLLTRFLISVPCLSHHVTQT